MMSALFTTAVDAKAILPVIPVENKPVGISVIWPPPSDMGDGAVIVVIVAMPEIKVILTVGAIVAALAIVGAAAAVANTFVAVMLVPLIAAGVVPPITPGEAALNPVEPRIIIRPLWKQSMYLSPLHDILLKCISRLLDYA